MPCGASLRELRPPGRDRRLALPRLRRAARASAGAARSVAIDSSGNAGASVAAYCARAGLACRIFAPAAASPAKLAQIEAYGADVELVPGPRTAAADAARAAAVDGVVYANHGWS